MSLRYLLKDCAVWRKFIKQYETIRDVTRTYVR